MVSEARSQGGNMQAMHNYIEKAFGPELPKKTTHSFFKYVMQNKVGVMTPQKFTGINDTQIHKFFYANHIIYQTLLRKKCYTV